MIGHRWDTRPTNRNTSESEDPVYFVIADNPQADVGYYPNSGKYTFRPPRKFVDLVEIDYYAGEE